MFVMTFVVQTIRTAVMVSIVCFCFVFSRAYFKQTSPQHPIKCTMFLTRGWENSKNINKSIELFTMLYWDARVQYQSSLCMCVCVCLELWFVLTTKYYTQPLRPGVTQQRSYIHQSAQDSKSLSHFALEFDMFLTIVFYRHLKILLLILRACLTWICFLLFDLSLFFFLWPLQGSYWF